MCSLVTGVQTCALPVSNTVRQVEFGKQRRGGRPEFTLSISLIEARAWKGGHRIAEQRVGYRRGAIKNVGHARQISRMLAQIFDHQRDHGREEQNGVRIPDGEHGGSEVRRTARKSGLEAAHKADRTSEVRDKK